MTDEEWEWLRRIHAEEEWIHCDSPQPLLTYLRSTASNRKFRLYAAACARRIWFRLPDASRLSVEIAERFADGQADEGERAAAETVADDIIDSIIENEAGDDAYHAALSAAWCARSFSLDAPYDAGHAAFYAAATERTTIPFVALLRCIFGNPFKPVTIDPTWLAWNEGTVYRIAQAIYDDRAFNRLSILADALEDAGCDNTDILTHLWTAGLHVCGCWPVDLILGKS